MIELIFLIVAIIRCACKLGNVPRCFLQILKLKAETNMLIKYTDKESIFGTKTD